MTDEAARRALREQMRQRRIALSASVRMKAAEAVATQARGIDAMRTKGYLAGYWATAGELPLHALLAPPPAFVYCLPCLTPDKRLLFAPWRSGDALVQNRYGIPDIRLLYEGDMRFLDQFSLGGSAARR